VDNSNSVLDFIFRKRIIIVSMLFSKVRGKYMGKWIRLVKGNFFVPTRLKYMFQNIESRC